MSLTHSTGFANFWFIEPDQKLRIHFEPGARYSYSGEGLILLQFVIENGRKEQGPGTRSRRLDESQFRPAGHDPHKPGLACPISPAISPMAGTTGSAAGTRRAKQGARRGLDGHDDFRSVEIRRRPGARRWPEQGLTRRDDQTATAHRNRPSVSALCSRSAGEGAAQGSVRRSGG